MKSLELTKSPANRSGAVAAVAVQRRSNEATRFRPGQSGNPTGRPRSKFRKLALKHLGIDVAANTKQADCVMDAIVQKAIEEGDVSAATFIRDIVDGKPGNSDTNAGPSHVSIEIIVVGGQ